MFCASPACRDNIHSICIFICKNLFCNQSKIYQYDNAQYNTVPPEDFEIMLLHIIDQEAEAEKRYHKRYHRTDNQQTDLRSRKCKTETHQL